MRPARLLFAALLCLCPALPGDARAAAPGLKQSMAEIGNASPEPSSFIVCHGRDCRIKTRVELTPQEWRRVTDIFYRPAPTAHGERTQISMAIGIMEELTGPKAGTAGDLGGTRRGAFSQGQMDCEDETMNTGTYLTMLENENLLVFHSVAGRAHRGVFLNGWPHRAVQIVENQTGRKFVVDSSFHDNGKFAEITPFAEWKDGWEPEGETQPARHFE